MVLVVGDVEAYYLLEFLVFFFEEREHKTVEFFLRVVHLELLPATEQQLTVLHVVAICHSEIYCMPLCPACRVEAAGTHQHAYHVERALFTAFVMVVSLAVFVGVYLPEIAFTVGKVVENLVYGVSFSLACSLAEIHWLYVQACIAEQCVAQNEVIIELVVTSRDQVTAVCILVLV